MRIRRTAASGQHVVWMNRRNVLNRGRWRSVMVRPRMRIVRRIPRWHLRGRSRVMAAVRIRRRRRRVRTRGIVKMNIRRRTSTHHHGRGGRASGRVKRRSREMHWRQEILIRPSPSNCCVLAITCRRSWTVVAIGRRRLKYLASAAATVWHMVIVIDRWSWIVER